VRGVRQRGEGQAGQATSRAGASTPQSFAELRAP